MPQSNYNTNGYACRVCSSQQPKLQKRWFRRHVRLICDCGASGPWTKFSYMLWPDGWLMALEGWKLVAEKRKHPQQQPSRMHRKGYNPNVIVALVSDWEPKTPPPPKK